MARRSFSIFSLSFLDVMACGLGATILFLMIISAQVRIKADLANDELRAEATRVEQEVEDARKNLLRLRSEQERTDARIGNLPAEIEKLRQLIAELQAKVVEAEGDSLAKTESIEQLRSDVKRLEESRQRLSEAQPEAASGQRIRTFVGRGNRQYLTGMKMGGKRVLILVDGSTSMLSRTYANTFRARAMPPERRVEAPKWRQTVATVEWLTSQIAPGSMFQIYVFNETAQSVVPGTEGEWLDAKTASDFDAPLAALRKVVPDKGTSLFRAFEAAQRLKPAPDNIYLLTDGLPTQGANPPPATEPVRADLRQRYLQQAVAQLPRGVPVNVVLFPMEGDPQAAMRFWDLAIRTRGSLLAPAKDWP